MNHIDLEDGTYTIEDWSNSIVDLDDWLEEEEEEEEFLIVSEEEILEYRLLDDY